MYDVYCAVLAIYDVYCAVLAMCGVYCALSAVTAVLYVLQRICMTCIVLCWLFMTCIVLCWLCATCIVLYRVTAVLCVFHGRWQRRLYPVAIQALLVGTYVGYNIWIFVSYYLNGSFPTLTPPSAIDSTLKKIKFDIWLLGRLLLGPCLAVTLPLVWTSLVLLMNLAIALGVKYGMSLSPMEHFEAMISVELVVPLTGWICVVALQNCAYRTLNVPWFSSKNALSKHAVILNEIAARRELKKTAQDHVRHDVNQYYLQQAVRRGTAGKDSRQYSWAGSFAHDAAKLKTK
eukprot:g77422.t1